MKLLIAVLLSLLSFAAFAAGDGSESTFASKLVGAIFLAIIGYIAYRIWERKKAKAEARAQGPKPPTPL